MEQMRVRLPLSSTQMREVTELAERLWSDVSIETVHTEATRDYTGDSNDDAADWLVVRGRKR